MKIRCENIVACGNYDCEMNQRGYCYHAIVALDASGKCTLAKPRPKPANVSKPAQEKSEPNKF